MTERPIFFDKNKLLKCKQNLIFAPTLRKLVYFFLDKEIKFCYLRWKFWVFFLI